MCYTIRRKMSSVLYNGEKQEKIMPNLLNKFQVISGTQANYKDKIFRYKLRNVYRILLCIIIVLAVCVLIKLQIENKVYTEVAITEKKEKVGTQTSVYTSFGGKLLVYSKDGISAYTEKGEQIFNQTYEMQNPLVSVKGNYVAVGDYKGTHIYVLDSTGLKGEINTNMMIQSLGVSEGGVVTTVLDDGDVTWMHIYSQTGELITKIRATMKQTGYPLAYELSPDNIKLAVAYVSQGGTLDTKMAFYNFGDVGQNTGERLVSAENIAGEIIPFVAYPTEETAIALSSRKLYFFKGKQIPKISATVELPQEVKSVYYGENQVALIYSNTESGDKYRLVTYDFAGKEKINRTFNMEYSSILVENERIIIYNESEVLILNRRGEEKFSGSVGENVVALIPGTSQNRFLVVTSDMMKYIELK